MSKALRKETMRSIRRTKARFISIIAIVALGISFFAGIKAAAPDMKATAEKYYSDNNLMDIWMISTLGFNDDDVQKVGRISGVANAMGSKFADGSVSVGGKSISDMGGAQTICRVYGFDLDKSNQFSQGTDNPAYINRINLLEGRYPQADNECVVDKNKLSTPAEFQIGNVVKVAGIEENIENKLSVTEFKIVGIIETPRYVSFERGQTTVGSGALGCFIYVPDTAFSMNYYTELCVTVEGAEDMDSYSDAYFDKVSSVMDKIQAISDAQLENRIVEVRKESEEKLNAAKEELAAKEKEAEDKLGSAFTELEKNRTLVENGDREIAAAEAEFEKTLSQKQKELLSGKNEYSAGIKEYNKKYDEYLKGQQEYEKAVENYANAKVQLKQLNDSVARLDKEIAEVEKQLAALNPDSGEDVSALSETTEEPTTGEPATEEPTKSEEQIALEAKLKELKKQRSACNIAISLINIEFRTADSDLAKAKKELEDANVQLAQAKKKLEASGIEINQGEIALSENQKKIKAQIAAKKVELEEAKKKLAAYDTEYSEQKEEAYAKLDSARYDIQQAEAQLEAATTNNAKWLTNDRNALPGYEGYGQTAQNMEAFATVFPLFFFIVAALVCLTTMTRMVDEERTQLGTLKALGYGTAAIRQKYLLYAFLASIIGSVLGLSVGFVLYPKAIFAAYGLMYQLPPLVLLFPVKYIVIGTAFAVLSTMITTYAACRKEMRSCPSQLMRPKAPKAGKRVLLERIPFIWKHLNFTSKVTVRNIFRNKKRFLMTLIGIAGCTALLVTGLGLKDSINAIITAQYGNSGVCMFDAQIALKNSQSSGAPSSIYNTIINNDGIEDAMMGYVKTVEGSSEKSESKFDVSLFVPQDNEKVNDFVDLKNRTSGEKYTLGDDGILLSEKFANLTGTSVGDTITLKFNNDLSVNIRVAGIIENYTFHYAYISRDLYEQMFDTTVKYNYVFAKYTDEVKANSGQVKLAEDLMKYNDINAVINVDTVIESFSTMFDSLNMVVIVFIVSAAALAFVVLYNLTNININERIREIASLKVLGFYNRESAAYVYRENIAITVLGTGIGLIMGIFLHRFVVQMAEVNVVMFGRSISVTSYILSVIMTFVFSLVVNFIMYFHVKKIDMVESLKSVE